MVDSFTPDKNVQMIAEAYALDAVDFAQKNFQIDLDWSDESVERMEAILEVFHNQLDQAKPPEETIMQFAKMFGSYVGEVFRRNHGATWGLVNLDHDSFPGLQSDRNALNFWPWGRARNRMVNGPEDNIWHYYQILLAKIIDA